MFGFIKKVLFGEKPATETKAEEKGQPAAEPVEPKRARCDQGRFIANDPSTPENEAWVGGKSPAQKRAAKKTTAKKPAAAKSTTAKKPAAAKATAGKKRGRKPKASS